jgi:hypothetical protein
LIHVLCQMLVVKTQFVLLIITLLSVHVNLHSPEIHFLVAFNFNIVVQTTNAQLEQSVATEFVTQSAQAQEIVSLIKCVFKACVNPPVKAIQPAPTFSTAKTIYVFKNQNVLKMKNVILDIAVQSILMEDQSVKMFAVNDSCVVETQIA